MTSELFKIYSTQQANETILRRVAVDDVPLSPRLEQGLQRVFGEVLPLESAVQRIVTDVRQRGDAAVRDWTEKIDGVRLESLVVSQSEVEAAYKQIPARVLDALYFCADRVRKFHQKQPKQSWLDWRESGGALGQMIRPLERVGIYAPGGTAPYPSTLIMCAVIARVAGVEEIIVTTPGGASNIIAPVLLAAAKVAQVDMIYRLGGAQAIAAMAFGTDTVTKVDKIVGPGNIFVTLAKRQVYGLVDIDGLPGPTETLVIADDAANPAMVAADLLAQAEHDTLASAILLTPSYALAQAVQVEVGRQLEDLSRAEIVAESLQHRGGGVICADLHEAVELGNRYAPEHLCLHVEAPWTLVGKIKNAGGIFLGEHAFEVLGDYTAGPAHVMPTMGTARFASPLSVRDFTKIISIFGLDAEEAAQIGPAAETLALAEGLDAHAAATRKRILRR